MGVRPARRRSLACPPFPPGRSGTSPRRGSPLLTTALALGVPVASADPGYGHDHELTATTILSGLTLTHSFTEAGTSTVRQEPLADPDDITRLGRDIFVGFQNGVGPQGQPSTSMNLDSTVVELTPNGHPVAQWDIEGKADGVTADPQAGFVIATVNEDANSSLYTITPGPGGGVQHYVVQRAAAPPRRVPTPSRSWRADPDQRVGARHDGDAEQAAPQPTYPAVTRSPSTRRTRSPSTSSPRSRRSSTTRTRPWSPTSVPRGDRRSSWP